MPGSSLEAVRCFLKTNIMKLKKYLGLGDVSFIIQAIFLIEVTVDGVAHPKALLEVTYFLLTPRQLLRDTSSTPRGYLLENQMCIQWCLLKSLIGNQIY